jgi:hypothetical protein
MTSTKIDATLAALEETFASDPERAELLRRARQFKSSWIELAQGLTEARKNGHWKNWGHETFEDYTRKELHLRQETVDKLTGSYSFLQRRAPAVLDRDGVAAPLPSYQSIDFLRRAEERADAPPAAVEEIRRKVLDEGLPIMQVAKQYNDVVFPIDEKTRKKQDAAGVKNVAKRLRELLSETRAVPRRLAGEVSESLDKLLAALGAEGTEEEAA